MALHPPAYDLTLVLAAVWESETLLSPTIKKLISGCIPSERPNGPSKENDLSVLQRAVAACDVLNGIKLADEKHWLSPDGQQFPGAIKKYLYAVACEIFDARDERGEPVVLPGAFSEKFAAFIKQSKSHVATLNYDGLLYNSLQNSGLMGGEQSLLLDGFKKRRFSRNNLFRKKTAEFSWYLHLHGSPIFCDDVKGNPVKIQRKKVEGRILSESPHLVLTSVEHKPEVITASPLLNVYWEFLDRAIKESDEVVLFGYSGDDSHLNDLVSNYAHGKSIRVVEWIGSGRHDLREKFWKQHISSNVSIEHLEDILEFEDW
ncbi:hypothetical protein R5H32_05695 [Defluviimonas sp. D31]|nr:hypothetical protein [Defluviimonas sp. D31]